MPFDIYNRSDNNEQKSFFHDDRSAFIHLH